MIRDDVLDLLGRINPENLTKTVLTMRGNSAVTLDAVIVRSDSYMVVRGREAGTNDEGRIFYLSYEDILYVKIDRILKIEDVLQMYGQKEAVVVAPTETPAATTVTETTPPPAEMQDPAAIAKQNLLARIRAARNAVSITAS
jgi:hypothetical protein